MIARFFSWVRGSRGDLQQRWIGWRVERDVKAGKYDDPITTRRRLARAVRPPEDDDTPDPDYDPAAVIERWIAKHIDPDGGDGMQRSWDW